MKYADIIIDISHEKLDKTFQYRIPPELEAQVTVGTQVWIPFGNGNRKIRGYVVELSDHPKVDAAKIKEIAGLPKDSVTIETQLIALAAWMKRTLRLHHESGIEDRHPHQAAGGGEGEEDSASSPQRRGGQTGADGTSGQKASQRGEGASTAGTDGEEGNPLGHGDRKTGNLLLGHP